MLQKYLQLRVKLNLSLGWVEAIVRLTGPIQQKQPAPGTAKLIKLGRISIGTTTNGGKSKTLSKSVIPASDCF